MSKSVEVSGTVRPSRVGNEKSIYASPAGQLRPNSPTGVYTGYMHPYMSARLLYKALQLLKLAVSSPAKYPWEARNRQKHRCPASYGELHEKRATVEHAQEHGDHKSCWGLTLNRDRLQVRSKIPYFAGSHSST